MNRLRPRYFVSYGQLAEEVGRYGLFLAFMLVSISQNAAAFFRLWPWIVVLDRWPVT